MATQLLHRRERVILTAIEIIGELGIQGLSTKEIAKREGISEGTLFRHFHTKNEIILAVLDCFTQYDEDVAETVRLKNMTARQSVLFVAESLATYYENYPAITVVSHLFGILSFDPELGEKVRNIVTSRYTFVVDIVRKGQVDGEFPDSNPQAIADAIYGTFGGICLRWNLSNRSFSLRDEVVLAIGLLLDAFTIRDRGKQSDKSVNY